MEEPNKVGDKQEKEKMVVNSGKNGSAIGIGIGAVILFGGVWAGSAFASALMSRRKERESGRNKYHRHPSTPRVSPDPQAQNKENCGDDEFHGLQFFVTDLSPSSHDDSRKNLDLGPTEKNVAFSVSDEGVKLDSRTGNLIQDEKLGLQTDCRTRGETGIMEEIVSTSSTGKVESGDSIYGVSPVISKEEFYTPVIDDQLSSELESVRNTEYEHEAEIELTKGENDGTEGIQFQAGQIIAEGKPENRNGDEKSTQAVCEDAKADQTEFEMPQDNDEKIGNEEIVCADANAVNNCKHNEQEVSHLVFESNSLVTEDDNMKGDNEEGSESSGVIGEDEATEAVQVDWVKHDIETLLLEEQMKCDQPDVDITPEEHGELEGIIGARDVESNSEMQLENGGDEGDMSNSKQILQDSEAGNNEENWQSQILPETATNDQFIAVPEGIEPVKGDTTAMETYMKEEHKVPLPALNSPPVIENDNAKDDNNNECSMVIGLSEDKDEATEGDKSLLVEDDGETQSLEEPVRFDQPDAGMSQEDNQEFKGTVEAEETVLESNQEMESNSGEEIQFNNYELDVLSFNPILEKSQSADYTENFQSQLLPQTAMKNDSEVVPNSCKSLKQEVLLTQTVSASQDMQNISQLIESVLCQQKEQEDNGGEDIGKEAKETMETSCADISKIEEHVIDSSDDQEKVESNKDEENKDFTDDEGFTEEEENSEETGDSSVESNEEVVWAPESLLDLFMELLMKLNEQRLQETINQENDKTSPKAAKQRNIIIQEDNKAYPKAAKRRKIINQEDEKASPNAATRRKLVSGRKIKGGKFDRRISSIFEEIARQNDKPESAPERRILIATFSVVSRFFGLSLVKFCLLVLMSMVLSNVYAN